MADADDAAPTGEPVCLFLHFIGAADRDVQLHVSILNPYSAIFYYRLSGTRKR